MLSEKLLFTPDGVCPVCGRVRFSGTGFLCAACEKSLPKLSGPACPRCGAPSEAEGRLCPACRDLPESRYFSGGAGLYHYRQAAGVRRLVHALKNGARPQLAEMVGEALGDVIRAQPFYAALDCVVPVPLHENRLRARGYNQSAWLARGVAAGGLDYAALLTRVSDTAHQRGLRGQARRENIRGAFKAVCPEDTAGKTVLLVDDVKTTGATLAACAAALTQAGAKAVYIACCAYA